MRSSSCSSQLFEIHEHVVRAGGDAQQLIELDLHGDRIAVLRALDQEHHEEGDDGGARVDHELPGIAPVKMGPLIAQAATTSTASMNADG